MSKLNEFIGNSKTFSGFMFRGSFDIYEPFLKMYDIFIDSGINLLDAYSEYTYLSWENIKSGNIYDYERCNKIDESLSLLRKYKIVDPDDLAETKIKISNITKSIFALS